MRFLSANISTIFFAPFYIPLLHERDLWELASGFRLRPLSSGGTTCRQRKGRKEEMLVELWRCGTCTCTCQYPGKHHRKAWASPSVW